jgi:glycosyltransferase involved in cell wall biosynthesis
MSQPPLRILQLHNHHAAKGGAMEVLAHERHILAEAGHTVAQLTLPAVENMGISKSTAGAKAIWNRQMADETRWTIEAFRPDVAHVHTPFPVMSPVVFRAAKGSGVPTVATVHSFRYSCIAATCHRDGRVCEDCVGRSVKWPAVRHRCYHDSLPGSIALATSLTLHGALGTFSKFVDAYLPLTAFARDLMVRDGFPPDRIHVKPNSVPDPGLVGRPDPEDPYLFFAGRLVEVKGVRTLLRAWQSLPTDPPIRLVLAGDGELRSLVQAAAASDPSIEWRGWLDEADISRAMAGALATIVPSEWYEAGAPLVTLRSLSVGTPVLSSDLENVSGELMADNAGWTFRTADATSLATQIQSLAVNVNSTLEKRAAARASYEARYSPRANLQQLETLYRRLSRRWCSCP